MTEKSRLLIVSGPYGSNKALTRSLGQICPGHRLTSLVTYHSRCPRPGEKDGVDHYYRSRAYIESMAKRADTFAFETACGLQAVNVTEIQNLLAHGDVLFEGDVHIALALSALPTFDGHSVVDVFVSPMSQSDVEELRAGHPAFEDRFCKLMRHRLLGDLDRMKQYVSSADIAEIDRRAGAAFHALTHAHQFAHVIPRCNALLAAPPSRARDKASEVFRWLAAGGVPEIAETWPPDLLPAPTCDAGGNPAPDLQR